LKTIQRETPELVDVRGLGSMVAGEFNNPGGGPFAFNAAFAKRVQREAMARGLILLTCGEGANVIRFLYPLTIEDAVFDEGLDILRASISAASSAADAKAA
jgi:4-aminobutyrate aminotransferase